jgi:hypothetical protein
MALPGKQFGIIQAKSLDPDHDLPSLRFGYRATLDLEYLRTAGLEYDDSFHGVGHFDNGNMERFRASPR